MQNICELQRHNVNSSGFNGDVCKPYTVRISRTPIHSALQARPLQVLLPRTHDAGVHAVAIGLRTLEGEARVFHIKLRCSIRIRLIRISKGRCRPANREQGIEKKRLLTHHMHLHSTALHRLRTYVRENGTGNTAIRIQIRDSEVELEKKLGKGIRNALPRALVPTHVQNGH